MAIKHYGADTGEHHQERRYSAPDVTSTVPIVESHEGQTVWEGEVEVFDQTSSKDQRRR